MIKQYGEDVLARAIEVFGESKQRERFVEEAGDALGAVMRNAQGTDYTQDTLGALADLILAAMQVAMAVSRDPVAHPPGAGLNLKALNVQLDCKLRALQRDTQAEEERKVREHEAWEKRMAAAGMGPCEEEE